MIDELPVGQGKKVDIDEYPPDFNPDTLVTQEAQPLKNRLKSAVFRIRVQAYEEALEQLDEVEVENLNAMILETNPQCQDKGLNVVQKYMITKGPIQPNVMRDIIKNLLEKAYTNLKVRAKVNSIFVFIFENGHKVILFEQIINMLIHKNPKVAQGTIALLVELLQQFGAKRMDNLKPFFGSINKLIEGQQAGTKNDAIAFYKEATKWLGKSIELHCGQLNDKLKQELNAIVEALPKDHAMKAVRCQAVEAPPTDLYEMADPIDAFKIYDEKWCNELLALEKWVEKKEKLEVLLKSVSQPKLLNHNNLYNLIQTLKRLIGDNNIAISNTAIKICGFIAQGLRKGFSQNAKILLQVIPLKLRDKKSQVVDEAIGCLKKFLYTLTLDEMYESLISLLEDKAPNTRVNVFQVFDMGIDENPRDKLIKLNNLKSLVLLSKKYVEDGNAEVRNKAIQLLAKISAKAYAGTLGIDFKGDKLSKYQSLLATYQSQFEDKEPKKQQLQSLQQTRPNPAPTQQQPKLQFVQEEIQIKQQPIQKIEQQQQQQTIQQNLYQQQILPKPQQPQQQLQQQAQAQPNKQLIQQEPQINYDQLPSQILRQQQSNILIQQYQQHPSFSANPQSTIIDIQEAPFECFEEQPLAVNKEIPQKQQNDQFKPLLGQYNKEVPQKQIDQKPKIIPPNALEQVLEFKAQLLQTQLQVQQSLNQNHIQKQSNQNQVRFMDEKSNEKLKSDDRMKALEQAKSMIGLQQVQVKASKKRNQENSQNLSNLFMDKNVNQDNQERTDDIYSCQVQGYKSVRDSKKGEMIGKRKDFDKEKQKRLQDYDKNGFICYSFSEPQWFVLRNQITQSQLQQPLIEKLFSVNPQQHILGMNIVKAKIKDVYPISDLLIKWAYMISYMSESIQLQQEIQIFFMDIIDKLKEQNQQLNHMEAKLLFTHTQMMCVVFSSQYNERMPNRVIPLILSNLVQVRKMGFTISEFIQQFPHSSEINFSAKVIYNYITESLDQYQDQTKQSDILAKILKQIQRDMSRIVSPSRMSVEQNDLIASEIPQRKQQKCEELYLEFIGKCELIKKDQFIYTVQGNLMEFLELAFAVGSFTEKIEQKKQFQASLLSIIQCERFLNALQYDEYYQLFDFLIQRTYIEHDLRQANNLPKEILETYNAMIMRLVTLGDIHYLYETLFSILIKTRNEGFQAKYKQISHIVIRIQNKVIGFIQKKFSSPKFPIILKKLEEFIQLCQQYPIQNFSDMDRLNFQSIQQTFTSLMNYGDTPQIQELFLKSETNSILRQWYADYMNKQKNLMGSTDQGLKQIINSLRLDFERASELFVAHLQKFYNPNWKTLVYFLNNQQIRYIEDRLQQEYTQEH